MLIYFDLRSFDDGTVDPNTHARVIEELCMGLAEANARWLIDHPETPLLYESGVYYRQETVKEGEWFKDIPAVLEQGYADCEDLASWRAAELTIFFGVGAEIFVDWQDMGGGHILYHVRVLTNYGPGGVPTVEDPSRVLGMGRYAA